MNACAPLMDSRTLLRGIIPDLGIERECDEHELRGVREVWVVNKLRSNLITYDRKKANGIAARPVFDQ